MHEVIGRIIDRRAASSNERRFSLVASFMEQMEGVGDASACPFARLAVRNEAILVQRFTPRVIPDHQVSIECRLTLRPEGRLPMYLERRMNGS